MRKDLKTLIGLLSGCKLLTLAYLFFTLVVASRNFLITYLTAYLSKTVIQAVQAGAMAGMTQTILRYLALLAVYLVIDALGMYFQSVTIHRLGNRLREKAMERILRAEMSALDAIGGRVEIITRMNADVDLVLDILGGKLMMPLMYLISGIGAIIAIFRVDLWLCAIMIVLGITIAVLDSLTGKPVRRVRREYQETRAGVAKSFEENHRLSLPIRLMDRSDAAAQGFAGRLAAYRRVCRDLGRISALRGTITQFDALIHTVGVALIGILLYRMGRIGVDDIVYSVQLAPRIIVMFSTVGGSWVALQNAMTGVERVHDLMNLPQEQDNGLCAAFDTEKPFIRCENAAIRYANGNYGYRGLNLTIPDHCIVGLRGGSGTGKSSLVKTLLRLYGHTDGEVTLFGQDIRSYALSFLRGSIAYVPQENLLFEGTYRENLTMGSRDLTDGQLMEMLAIVGSTDWIRERGGLSAAVREGGHDISGGQRQQIAIARALLSDKRIIIFDEAFAGVDAAHIGRIMGYLDAIKHERALLIVSHDEQVLSSCECLVESGPSHSAPGVV